jgi:hypothetical protein
MPMDLDVCTTLFVYGMHIFLKDVMSLTEHKQDEDNALYPWSNTGYRDVKCHGKETTGTLPTYSTSNDH